MIYALYCKATDSGPITENGKLAAHQSFQRFASQDELKAAQDKVYTGRDGYNLVEVAYATVQHFIGRMIVWRGGYAYSPIDWVMSREQAVMEDGAKYSDWQPDDDGSIKNAQEAIRQYNANH